MCKCLHSFRKINNNFEVLAIENIAASTAGGRNTVIYILGSARSGSTILNILLGNNNSIFSAGELNRYVSSGWIGNEYCSCGVRVSDCEFWPQVQRSVETSLKVNPYEIAEITRGLENWRNILYWWKRKRLKCDIDKHNLFYERFIESVLEHTDASHLVDASKDPARLSYLSQVKSLDIYTIHIVRDPRAICWSKSKPFKSNPKAGVEKDLASIPYWRTMKSIYMNVLLAVIHKYRNPKDRYLRIKYEDLANNTNPVLGTLESYLGVDFSSVSKRLKSTDGLDQEHTVAGNRLRMNKKIKLNYDNSWVSDAPLSQRIWTTILALPLLLILGYKVIPTVQKNAK